MPDVRRELQHRRAAALIRNLMVLKYDFEKHGVPKCSCSLLAFFKLPRRIEFMHILHFLFRNLHPLKYEAELSGLEGPKLEVAFKKAVNGWLRSLSTELPGIASSFFAIWGFPTGHRVLRLLAGLSSYVLVVTNSSVFKPGQSIARDKLKCHSVKKARLNLIRSRKYVLLEVQLLRKLRNSCGALEEQVHLASEELLKTKQLILSDSDIRIKMKDISDSAFCLGETNGPSDELIAYRIQMERKVAALRQQLGDYLNKYKPSLLLLDDILNNLDEQPTTLNGFNMKFLRSKNTLPLSENDKTSSNNKQEPERTDDELDFSSFLRHSATLFQMASKSYNSPFIDDITQKTMTSQYKSSNANDSADCLSLFRQAVDHLHSQSSSLNECLQQTASSSETNSQPSCAYPISLRETNGELCWLMEEMHRSIDELVVTLKPEWLSESHKGLDFSDISNSLSTGQSCLSQQTLNAHDKNYTFCDESAKATTDKTNKVLSTGSSSIEVLQNNCINHPSFGGSMFLWCFFLLQENVLCVLIMKLK
ncbi:unnamed protein product [Heterobilharzia americana]|nr:unnamed protein product [Heterobilharzia americana]